MTKLSALLAVCVTTLALSACHTTPTRSATDLPPGKYEKSTTSTDANGTTTTRDNTTNVTVDQYGNKHAVVKSDTTKDPKGLFNKTTTSSTREEVKER